MALALICYRQNFAWFFPVVEALLFITIGYTAWRGERWAYYFLMFLNIIGCAVTIFAILAAPNAATLFVTICLLASAVCGGVLLSIQAAEGTTVKAGALLAVIGAPEENAPSPQGGNGGQAQPGRVCPKLGGSLACPGLIVPIDPDHLARIVQATRHLEAARERIDPVRFGLFYAPSLQVLTQDLLPAFPPEMMPDAERLMCALPSLPDLE